MWLITAVVWFLLISTGHAIAQAGPGMRPQPGSSTFQNNTTTGGSTETLPGGFRRFRDNNGNTGILQRTPNSGFPNSQFIAPVTPALPPSAPAVEQVPPSQAPPPTRLPQILRPENLPAVPGLPIGPQNR